MPASHYHNDWLTVLASAGAVGLAALALIVWRLFRLEAALVVPFLLPGLTNAFMFAPQHFMLLMVLAGVIVARRYASENVPDPQPDTAPRAGTRAGRPASISR